VPESCRALHAEVREHLRPYCRRWWFPRAGPGWMGMRSLESDPITWLYMYRDKPTEVIPRLLSVSKPMHVHTNTADKIGYNCSKAYAKGNIFPEINADPTTRRSLWVEGGVRIARPLVVVSSSFHPPCIDPL